MTLLIMVMIFACMAWVLFADIKVLQTSDHFFNSANTGVFRGLWSIVVILVHIPEPYQNTLQDMIGSFGYIAVTFFFMTSAYGLRKLAIKNGIRGFWKRRLPKLLVPMAVINIATACFDLIVLGRISLSSLLLINHWVRWLLFCYFLFWLVYRLECIKQKDTAIGIAVVAFSLFRYIAFPQSGWTTEIYGFIWGILLGNETLFRNKSLGTKEWIANCLMLCGLSAGLGTMYLKCKSILFWGDYLLKILLGLVILCLILCVNQKVCFGSKAGLWLGNISYEMYLTHALAMRILLEITKDWMSGVFIAASVLLTVFLSALEKKVNGYILKRIRL